jgi:hypothetical protein
VVLQVEITNRYQSLHDTIKRNKLFMKLKDCAFLEDRKGPMGSEAQASIDAAIPSSPPVIEQQSPEIKGAEEPVSRSRNDSMSESSVKSTSTTTTTTTSPRSSHQLPQITKVTSVMATVSGQGKAEKGREGEIIQNLNLMIEELEEQLDDSKVACLQILKKGDLTPGSLLFYSTLSDQQAISAFKLLYRILSDLRSFAVGNHGQPQRHNQPQQQLDFTSIRLKLTECMTAMPVLDRFITRYTDLYKKWVQSRMQVFTKRGLSGGFADQQYTCPICHVDSRICYKAASDQRSFGYSSAVQPDIRGLFPSNRAFSGRGQKGNVDGDEEQIRGTSAQRLRENITSARDDATSARLAPTFKLPTPAFLPKKSNVNDDDLVSLSSFQSGDPHSPLRRQHQQQSLPHHASGGGT